MILDIATVVLVVVGLFFYAAGSIGVLRFPDYLSRLHALTKADNVGLGFVVLGLILQSGSAAVSAKLFIIWGLALLSAATAAALLARSAGRSEPKL
ncbi:monovalent cation/H(+) antiporter subunit G [Rhodococcus sp. 14-2470-1a]|uniref:cation:proton antiporter n=1 Tax=Rhodococcus sp. 14-2470-1a TaxID=2023150 RepID=UPI000B9A9DD7|nr:monovalent cation/H(+) antiporter subunit G [Rhodococcus sp. 14-2470-1a]OZF42004.1 Na+/H+ antiporter subunit G [Rhodococcus sp. 14-2470-1a]